MESTRPIPGITSPRAAIRIPSGPSRTAVPSRTSTTVHPGMVVGLVSGAGAKGCLAAIVVPDGLAFGCDAEPADKRAPDVTEGLGMLPTKAGADVCRSGADAVFGAPSILPPDLVSGICSAGDSLAIGLRPSMLANSGQLRPLAHPSPKLASSAIVDSKKLRARTPYGSRRTSTSSRSRLRSSHAPAGCLSNGPSATLPDQMLPRVLGSRSCMARPTFGYPDDGPLN